MYVGGIEYGTGLVYDAGMAYGEGFVYEAGIVVGGISPPGLSTVAAGGAAEFFATGPVAVHEASNRAMPAAMPQLAATRCRPGLPFRKLQFDPSGPMMMLSLVLTIEARKFTKSGPNGETRQEQSSICRARIF